MDPHSYKARKAAEKRATLEAQREAREAEERRVASLCIWSRIEEADDLDDIKAVLHLITAHVGMD